MLHPYWDGQQVVIEAKLKTETRNGKPHGMCIMTYSKEKNQRMNFTGYGVMVDGQLSNSPAIFIT